MNGGDAATAAVDKGSFRRVLGRYPTGVALVTTVDDDGPAGMVVGSFGSVSLDPPLVQFLPTAGSATWQRVERTGRFCVNVLGSAQRAIVDDFMARKSEAFGSVPWSPSIEGLPWLTDAQAWIDCTIEAVHEAGDHLIVLGRVLHLTEHECHPDPMVFLGGRYGSFAELVAS